MILVYGLVGLAALAFWPSVAVLSALWTDFDDTTLTHGFLIVAVCLWLIFHARHRIATASVRPLIAANVALLGCGLAWLIFWRAAIQDLHVLLFPALIWLAVLAAFGWPIARLLAFPLAWFCFALPVWSYLEEPLRDLTTYAVGVLAWVTGLPAYIEGNTVTIPSGVFEIAGGCSGKHFLVVGLATAALQGEIMRDSPRRRLLLLAVMGGLALLSNWLRVFTIILAGHLTDMQHYLITVEHYWYGWALFVVVILLFTWFTSRPRAAGQGDEPPVSVALGSSRALAGPYAATALALVAVPALGYTIYTRPDVRSAGLPPAMPAVSDGWSGPFLVEDTPWRPVFTGADGEWQAIYRHADGYEVEAYAVIYHAQRQGAELIGMGNSVLGHGGLKSESERIVVVDGDRYREIVAIGPQAERSLIVWSYDIAGRQFVHALPAQLWYGVRSLVRPARASLLALRIQCRTSCDAARAALERFIGGPGRNLQAALAGSVGEN